MIVINEENVKKEKVSERYLQWLISDDGAIQSDECACCIVTLLPHTSATPPHAHQDCEEAIFVLEGEGKMLASDGMSEPVKAGSLILVRKKRPHMLVNTGEKELKAICFYSSATDVSQYTFYTEEELNF